MTDDNCRAARILAHWRKLLAEAEVAEPTPERLISFARLVAAPRQPSLSPCAACGTPITAKELRDGCPACGAARVPEDRGDAARRAGAAGLVVRRANAARRRACAPLK